MSTDLRNANGVTMPEKRLEDKQARVVEMERFEKKFRKYLRICETSIVISFIGIFTPYWVDVYPSVARLAVFAWNSFINLSPAIHISCFSVWAFVAFCHVLHRGTRWLTESEQRIRTLNYEINNELSDIEFKKRMANQDEQN